MDKTLSLKAAVSRSLLSWGSDSRLFSPLNAIEQHGVLGAHVNESPDVGPLSRVIRVRVRLLHKDKLSFQLLQVLDR